MVTFTHLEPGLPDEQWLAAPRLAAMAPLELDFSALDRLVVVSAHPDDETLAAAGLIQQAAASGLEIRLVVATLGEGSHPSSATHTPAQLASLRRTELAHAVGLLSPGAAVEVLGLPDGGLAAHLPELTAAIARNCAGARTLVVAPWAHDGHADHDAAGSAAAQAVRQAGGLLLEYPVWLWHWGTPEHPAVPWPSLRRLDMTAAEQSTKHEAVQAHRSQVAPLSPQPGDEALLSPSVLAHFARPFETYIDAQGRFTPTNQGNPHWLTVQFDAIHRNGAEPWNPRSWYEQRKRALCLALLPRRTYASGLEIGCSTGYLSADLAPRTTGLLAVDASAEAIETASARLAGLSGARAEQRRIPKEWPPGRFDLVVLSEVGYYLTAGELADVVGRVCAAALPDTVLLACHWRHPIEGWSLDGNDVHRLLRSDGRLALSGSYLEADFAVDVFGVREAG